MTTLANERVAIGSNAPARSQGIIAQAIDAYAQAKAAGDVDAVATDRLLTHWVNAEVLRLTTLRANSAASGGTPGPEGSTAKLQWAELNKAVSSFTLELLGPAGVTYPRGYTFERPSEPGLSSTDPHHAFLRSRANSIEGGTSEIMRNILGERVLGLPGEPRVDKDVAWRDVPRN
jgi:alkylation response protein AidB-like acyl-CoA dehydrogenase